MKSTFLFSTLACLCLFSAFTHAEGRPTKCPSVESLKAVGLTEVKGEGIWLFHEKDYFDTDHLWSFLFIVGESATKETAVNKAQRALNTLSYHFGPDSVEGETWVCLYHTALNGASGAAFYPSFDDDLSLSFATKAIK